MLSHRASRLTAGLVLAGCTHLAHAAGFALIEQNASGLGNAYAGAGAVAEDASTVYYNPAGMTLLPDRQIVLVGHLIKPKMEFSGTVAPAVGGGQGGDAGDLAFVPNAYFAFRLTPDVHLGLGVNSPFGLKTEYDAGWLGRFQAVKSEVTTVNVNPSIAWKASDRLSLGGGLNVQRIDATLSNSVSPRAAGSFMTVEGDDYGWGWNVGALWQPATGTRIGLAYRSEVDYTLEGTLTANAVLPSGDVTADITLPANASLSAFHKLSPNVDLLADVTWTGWSAFDRLAVVYTSLPVALPATQENWNDTWRYSLGATWHMSEKLSLRGGVAYDEAPVSDLYRTPRIPDGARTWVAVGGQYRTGRRGAIDFGYAHLFVEDVALNSRGGGTALSGTYASQVDVVSAQYTHSF